VKLNKRILYLCDDVEQLRAQLDGTNLESIPADLTFGVNTDAMISGRACTFGYTPSVLGPYFLQNFKEVVQESDIAKGNFQVAVGGHAYGTGSSREAAVVAHRGSGIELVVAQSFQRIFQENMVYDGLPFTTDFGVVDRLKAGEDVPTSEFTQALPPFFKAVAQKGGLLAYGSSLLAGQITPDTSSMDTPKAMNVVEKIVAATAFRGLGEADGVVSVDPGMQVLCKAGFRGMHEYTAGMVLNLYEKEWGQVSVDRPELAASFEDHFVLIDHDAVPERVKAARLGPAKRLTAEMVEVCKHYGIKIHGPGRDLPAGVCHRIVVEDYALPGSIVILTDSHTPTAGVLNTFAFGVGSTAMAFALRTGMIPVTVPKVVRVLIDGRAEGRVTPKDLILHLIGDPYFRNEEWRESPTDTCVMQLGGPGLEDWTVDELSVLTNMSVEGGLMTGILEPIAQIVEFLRKQRGTDVSDQLVYPDEGATYAREMRINLEDVPVTVATPGDSRNRESLDRVGHVPIHNIVIASCTGGSLADLAAAAEVLQGRSLAEGVRLTVTPSSENVHSEAERLGYLKLFRSLGAVVTQPGCGSCIGNGPGIPEEGETTASTTNRNFSRRMGAPGPVYLVSPAVAAASGVMGHLADPASLESA
jgi:3-isopropylmalate/(R)-2-methylmalate dehydratase large subunit